MNSAKGKKKILPGISVGDFASVSKATGEEKAGLGEVVDIGDSLPMSDTQMSLPQLQSHTTLPYLPANDNCRKAAPKCVPPSKGPAPVVRGRQVKPRTFPQKQRGRQHRRQQTAQGYLSLE